MEFLKKIILTACIISIAVTIADCLKPGEKYSRQLKNIFSVIFVSGLIAAAVKTGIDFQLPEFDVNTYSQEYSDIERTADAALETEVEKRIDEIAENLLKNEKISCEKIVSDININEDGGISINRIDYKGDDFEQARRIIEENFSGTEVNRIE
ncbi:MAG: hypothetical protein ACI4JB_10385 [Porcipelethomonas sp.]